MGKDNAGRRKGTRCQRCFLRGGGGGGWETNVSTLQRGKGGETINERFGSLPLLVREKGWKRAAICYRQGKRGAMEWCRKRRTPKESAERRTDGGGQVGWQTGRKRSARRGTRERGGEQSAKKEKGERRGERSTVCGGEENARGVRKGGGECNHASQTGRKRCVVETKVAPRRRQRSERLRRLGPSDGVSDEARSEERERGMKNRRAMQGIRGKAKKARWRL